MFKKAITILLGLFIILDLAHSYRQYLYMPLDGDVAENVVPAAEYRQVLKDPIGWEAITQGKKSAGVNRFFAHWSMYTYMRHAPFFFQIFSSPIDSVYIACAVFRLLTQIAMLYLLGVYVTRKFNPLRLDFLLACALMLPFFQVQDYAIYMAIIHHSITYTFFYAFALCAVLAFFLPFYLALRSGSAFSLVVKILLFAGTFVLAFNGPIVPPVSILIILLILWYKFRILPKQMHSSFASRWISAIKSLPRSFLFYFTLLALLSFYSLYLGSYNSDNDVSQLSLWERYARLPEGIYNMFTQKLGFPLLFLALGINVFILKKYLKNCDGERILDALKYIGIFSLIYILLLPLGGYRSYRPNIIRHDTAMPITIALLFFYGLSSLFILKNLVGRRVPMYAALCVVFAFIYSWADKDVAEENVCEKKAIATLASSPKDTVLISGACTIMSWEKLSRPEDSRLNTRLLQHWGVLDKEKYYYQE